MSHSNPEPAFPPVVVINGRNYVSCYEFELYKAALLRHAMGGQSAQAQPPRPEYDGLIAIGIAASELGIGRRSIGRRMKVQNTDPEAA
jgi:hypothetical protein